MVCSSDLTDLTMIYVILLVAYRWSVILKCGGSRLPKNQFVSTFLPIVEHQHAVPQPIKTTSALYVLYAAIQLENRFVKSTRACFY